ncbi:MAG: AI-2E family transporter [Bdellovibrionaceae bacterium]|nr:AI-2E family transporter [Pseudobdellovibrionaceae bacterium]
MKTQSSGDIARIILTSSFIIMLLGGTIWILTPFLPATIWAITIVVTTWPWLLWLQNKMKSRRGPAVAVMMTGLVFAVILPMAIAVSLVLSLIEQVTEWSKTVEEFKIPAPPHWISDLPVMGAQLSESWTRFSLRDPQELLVHVQPYLKSGGVWAVAVFGSFGMSFVHLSLSVAIAAILYYKGEKATEMIIALAQKLSVSHGEEVVVLAGKSIKAVALGIVVTAAAQSLLAAIGLWVANVPLTGLLAAAALILTMVQVGPFIPLLVGVAWLFSKDQTTAAILLLVWTGIVGVSDNIMRPMLISKGADMPFVLIFSGVIGGIFAFGVVGTFIGPVILAVTYDLFKSWTQRKEVSL